MKNIVSGVITLLLINLFSFHVNAQSAAKDEAGVLKMWDAVWSAYESNDEAKMWSFYADDACEVYPDGSCMCGLKAIREGYDQFKDMLEGIPSWKMTTPTINFIGSDVALLISDVTSDIKLKGGQQIGGKSKFVAVLHRVKGQWLIKFDSQTPIMEMPVPGN